jgi:hypothetical protein
LCDLREVKKEIQNKYRGRTELTGWNDRQLRYKNKTEKIDKIDRKRE